MRTWTELWFGKHKGKTLPQVVFQDPDWFFWAVEERVFQGKGKALAAEAAEIDRKARNIRVPQDGAEPLEVEYLIHQPTMKFGDLQVVPKSRAPHQGGSPSSRSDRINMSYPRTVKSYDKTGCKLLIGSLKFYLFGDTKARLTKQRVEAFFETEANFMK